MKRIILYLVVLAAAITGTARYITTRLEDRHAQEAAAREKLWLEEKSRLEADLKKARTNRRDPITIETTPAPASPVLKQPSPQELIQRLSSIGPATASQIPVTRRIIHDFEELIAAGPVAIPAIRDFLARNEEVDYVAGSAKGLRNGVPEEFLLPPSLRFGLFHALKQIGGPEAEKLLSETLATTGRGVELVWLARVLQEMAPDKYRDLALASAHELLNRPQAAGPVSPLDGNDRDNLLNVLAMYNDTSFVTIAQSQLIQADGTLDRSSLRYLQQTLGQQSVGIAANAWNDPRLTDPTKKEPLARLALTYAGADALANDLYLRAINDLNLSKDQRRNLIEDLNQDGFPRNRKLEAGDLPLIESRIALIEQSAPKASDPINVAAFKEAYKDLVKMRERLVNPAK